MQIDERMMMRNNIFFTKLLGEHSYGSMATLLRDADDLKLPLRLPYHRMIVAEVETWGELLSRTNTHYEREDRSEAFFVISNICMEAFCLHGACHVCFTDFQGRLVFWIDADTPCPTSAFESAAKHVAEIIESEFQIVTTFSVGYQFENLFTTFKVNQDVLTLLFYFRYISAPQSVYTMRQIPETSTPLTLSDRCAWERRLLQRIEAADFEEIKAMLQESFQKRFLEDSVSLKVFPHRHASFRELLEVTAAELARRYSVGKLTLDAVVDVLASAESGAEQLSMMERFMDEISAALSPERQEVPPAWVTILMDYVREHYTDPNITVYQLAEMVGITPSYCTRVFRRYTGMSLLEYIQRQRVREAIALLESGCTMAQAAWKSGFTCTQTLRRTLKQYSA